MLRVVFIVALAGVPAAAQPPDLPAPPRAPSGQAAGRNREVVSGLIEALRDLDPDVRQHSAIALAAIGPEAIPALIQVLTDKIKERRAAAAYALGQMGEAARDAMPSLLTVLKDDDAAVRRSAAQAISRIVSSDIGAGRVSVKPLPALTTPRSNSPVPANSPPTPLDEKPK